MTDDFDAPPWERLDLHNLKAGMRIGMEMPNGRIIIGTLRTTPDTSTEGEGEVELDIEWDRDERGRA